MEITAAVTAAVAAAFTLAVTVSANFFLQYCILYFDEEKFDYCDIL